MHYAFPGVVAYSASPFKFIAFFCWIDSLQYAFFVTPPGETVRIRLGERANFSFAVLDGR